MNKREVARDMPLAPLGALPVPPARISNFFIAAIAPNVLPLARLVADTYLPPRSPSHRSRRTRPDLLSTHTIFLAAALVACSAPETSATTGSATPAAPATAATPAGPDSSSLLTKADQGRIRGDSSAKLWLIMVSDFQCPYCREWHDQVFATVMRDYVATGKVRVAYLNFPLGIHPNAMPAAEAAMCASVQGKFWEMHDAIFRTQDQWAGLPDPRPVFDSLAKTVGVSPAAYRSCVESKATRPMILADQQRASVAGVRATPTFFIGNGQLEGAVPLPEFRAALDKALAGSR